jgi:hypothetical protein
MQPGRVEQSSQIVLTIQNNGMPEWVIGFRQTEQIK